MRIIEISHGNFNYQHKPHFYDHGLRNTWKCLTEVWYRTHPLYLRSDRKQAKLPKEGFYP